MKKLVSVLLLVAACAGTTSFAAAIIDATFDSQPLGALTTQPRTSPQPLTRPESVIRDTASDRVDVANPVGNFSSRVLLLDATASNLASATFYNPIQYTNGIYSVSWDSLITQPTVGTAANTVVLGSQTSDNGAPVIIGIGYDPSGAFKIGNFDPGQPFHLTGSYSVGNRQHFEFLVDLNAHTYRLFLDGNPLDNGPLFDSSGFDLTSFDANGRGSAANPPPFAVDNVRVEQVPELHTVLLAVVGFAPLSLRRKQRGC